MLRSKETDVIIASKLEQLITGAGSADVINLLKEIVEETTLNIIVTGLAGSGKSTMVKALAGIEAESKKVGWTENEIMDVVNMDTSSVAIGEIAQDRDYKNLTEHLIKHKRIFAGHHANVLRMPRIFEEIFMHFGYSAPLAAEQVGYLMPIVVTMCFVNGVRVIESITAIKEDDRAFSFIPLAYYDVFDQKYVVDIPNAAKVLQ